jgi:lactate permease
MILIILSLIPILWLLISLGFFKMAAHKACPVGLLLSLSFAVLFWQMDITMALKSALEGVVFALFPISWVIVAAFFAYNISQHTGAINQIKEVLLHYSEDRRLQALLIAWGFGSFMESVAGFGTAVAVPAALLIALGFEPFRAAIICLIANTVAVAFGVIGIPLTTLALITDLPVMNLSLAVVLQLTPFVIIVPLLVIYAVTGSLTAFHGIWRIAIAAGISFGLTQFVVARSVGPELPAVAASLVSSATIILLTKTFPPVVNWRFHQETPSRKNGNTLLISSPISYSNQLIAWMPYLLLLIFVVGSSKLFPGVNNQLSSIRSVWPIYDGPGGKPLTVDWLLTPGTLVLLSALIGGRIQGASRKDLTKIFGATLWQLRKTMITVVTIVSMAKVLGYSGMVNTLAFALATGSGTFYPAFAPVIGALGTFITGSDTSANILFGLLQKQTAIQLGLDPEWIAAANTSGACIGKLISPQSIAIAATATGLGGKEGVLLAVTFRYASLLLLGLGLLVYGFAY